MNCGLVKSFASGTSLTLSGIEKLCNFLACRSRWCGRISYKAPVQQLWRQYGSTEADGSSSGKPWLQLQGFTRNTEWRTHNSGSCVEMRVFRETVGQEGLDTVVLW